jgi:hypothetical protein
MVTEEGDGGGLVEPKPRELVENLWRGFEGRAEGGGERVRMRREGEDEARG